MKLKKIICIFSLFFIFGVTGSSYSIPAYPKEIKIIQKDGSIITIIKHGDEYFNYTTTVDGYMISQRDGIYFYSDITFDGSRIVSKVKANNPSSRNIEERKMLSSKNITKSNPLLANFAYINRSSRTFKAKEGVFPTEGDVKSIIILVNFKDVKFTSVTAKEDFTSMLNSPSYAENNGEGSAKDYFLDNSQDKFNPQFDVYGPVELKNNMGYYGGNNNEGFDEKPESMVEEACVLANDEIDFSQYDYDGDGEIDNVFIYYAGYNEAEGASENTIWPHKYDVRSRPTIDGKILFNYACTSELSGANASAPNAGMAGIGTFVHEFGHVLGLADTYDTVGGESAGLLIYDVMTSGGYNNEGRTPPYYMAYQRYELGWMVPKLLEKSGNFTLNNISQNDAYIINTSSDGEYFLLEYRNATSSAVGYNGRNWDSGMIKIFPSSNGTNGVLITHIDRSENMVGEVKAIDRWNRNIVNNLFSHECARIVYSNGEIISSEDKVDTGGLLFPNSKGVDSFSSITTPAAVDWNGNDLFINISEIKVGASDNATFTNDAAKYILKPSTNGLFINFLNTESKNSWNIKWRKVGEESFNELLDYNYKELVIAELEINTDYQVVIELSMDGGEYENESDSIIKTLPLNSSYPTILFDYEQLSGSALFTPVLFNFEGDMTTVKWSLDGVETKINYKEKMLSGDYIIICEFENNGVTDRIYKELNIK